MTTDKPLKKHNPSSFIDSQVTILKGVTKRGSVEVDGDFYVINPNPCSSEPIIRVNKESAVLYPDGVVSCRGEEYQMYQITIDADAPIITQTVSLASTLNTSICSSLRSQRSAKKLAPHPRDILRSKARINSAEWTAYRESKEVRIDGYNFCNEGDIVDVCSYGVDSRGVEVGVEFARYISSIYGSVQIIAQLNHGHSWAEVYVAVRNSGCSDADGWSDWKRVS